MAKSPFFYGVKSPSWNIVPVAELNPELHKTVDKYALSGKQVWDRMEYYNCIFIDWAQVSSVWPIQFTIMSNDVQVFLLDIAMSAKEYNTYSDILAELLWGKVVDSIKITAPLERDGQKKFSKRLLGSISQAFDYLAVREGKMAEMNDIYTENIDMIEQFNTEIPIQDVIESFGMSVSGGVVNKKNDMFLDTVNNRLIDINPTRCIVWLPFDMVLSYNNNNPRTAFIFINKRWNFNFEIGEEQVGPEQFFAWSLMGTRIMGMNGMICKDGCYYNKKFVQITDFVVDAYAKIIREEEVSYLIKLTNAKNETTDFFEIGWLKGNSNFRNVVTSKGAFHFYGQDDDVMMIHSQISDIDLTTVSSVQWYGFHKRKLFMRNGIYDTVTKQTSFTAEWDYVFEKGHGYNVIAGNGFSMTGTVPEQFLPYLSVNPPKGTKEEFWELFEGLYKDDMGILLLVYVCAVLANGHFGAEKKFPYLFFSWVKGSGKSTASEILRRIFWVGIHTKWDSAIMYSNATPFAMTVYASSFSNIPIYLTEFQNDCRGAESKEKIMLAIYDGSGDLRGRADQTTQAYQFNSLPVLDGEECSRRGAVRSRSILVNVRKINKNADYVDFERRFNSKLLQSLIYCYYEQIDDSEEKYDDYYAEAMATMLTSDERTRENMALLYAGAMLWFPEKKERILQLLNSYIEGQIADQNASEGLNEVFSYIKKYMNNMQFANIWTVGANELYINMDNFFAHYHANQNRSTHISFADEAYMKYIDDSPWELKYCEVWDSFIELLRIPIDAEFPMQLLCIPGVYQKYKKALSLWDENKIIPTTFS